MAYTTIDNPTDYFTTVLTTSTGSALTIDTGFKPDWLWTKARNQARSHELHDTTRGDNKRLKSDTNTGEESYSNYLAFTSTGATLGTNHNLGYHAGGSTTGVCWAWKANGGNTTSVGVGTADGNTTTACVRQVNTTAGFGIYTYTADSNGEQFIEHGLPSRPLVVIVKDRGNTESWQVGHEYMGGWSKFLQLDENAGVATNSNRWLNTEPSANVINIGSGNSVGASGRNYVCYAFSPIQGYSKFGSWTGNANDDGPFIYTGFKPAFLLFKNASASERWFLSDNKRDTFNSVEKHMRPDVNEAEYSTTTSIDYLSNGFKIREDDAHMNGSDNTIIYMAFAESPFVSSKGVPTTAR